MLLEPFKSTSLQEHQKLLLSSNNLAKRWTDYCIRSGLQATPADDSVVRVQ